jgi:hypothetical protein
MPAARPFHLMTKPTGAVCNLGCDYCYFLKKEELYPGSSFRMSDAVLAGALVLAGLALALYVPGAFALGGWLTGALLLAFAFVGRSAALRDGA